MKIKASRAIHKGSTPALRCMDFSHFTNSGARNPRLFAVTRGNITNSSSCMFDDLHGGNAESQSRDNTNLLRNVSRCLTKGAGARAARDSGEVKMGIAAGKSKATAARIAPQAGNRGESISPRRLRANALVGYGNGPRARTS
ncbi:uncharacterized protein [Physcomitrium patens]|uniref:Uncharacterized protein n=1 Tax=Physcomitrium patens TaxID=3218 RepID=A0A2K1IIU8_PHYPA|nr:hypothetical protein PHYPA_027881 [Physcomitrium patens]